MQRIMRDPLTFPDGVMTANVTAQVDRLTTSILIIKRVSSFGA